MVVCPLRVLLALEGTAVITIKEVAEEEATTAVAVHRNVAVEEGPAIPPLRLSVMVSGMATDNARCCSLSPLCTPPVNLLANRRVVPLRNRRDNLLPSQLANRRVVPPHNPLANLQDNHPVSLVGVPAVSPPHSQAENPPISRPADLLVNLQANPVGALVVSPADSPVRNLVSNPLADLPVNRLVNLLCILAVSRRRSQVANPVANLSGIPLVNLPADRVDNLAFNRPNSQVGNPAVIPHVNLHLNLRDSLQINHRYNPLVILLANRRVVPRSNPPVSLHDNQLISQLANPAAYPLNLPLSQQINPLVIPLACHLFSRLVILAVHPAANLVINLRNNLWHTLHLCRHLNQTSSLLVGLPISPVRNRNRCRLVNHLLSHRCYLQANHHLCLRYSRLHFRQCSRRRSLRLNLLVAPQQDQVFNHHCSRPSGQLADLRLSPLASLPIDLPVFLRLSLLSFPVLNLRVNP